MNLVERFVLYSVAFEEAYRSRRFSSLEEHFTEDAVYDIAGPGIATQRHEGRDAVLTYMEWITDAFDLRFARRQILRVAGPEERDGVVEVSAVAVYTLDSGERCHLSMSEAAHFEGERIARLVDSLSPGGVHEMKLVVEKHPDRFPAGVLG